MQTIRLRINDRVYKNLMWFLGKFNKEEIEIIEENDQFLSIQEYLNQQLNLVDSGKMEFMDIDELDSDLENTLRRNEN